MRDITSLLCLRGVLRQKARRSDIARKENLRTTRNSAQKRRAGKTSPAADRLGAIRTLLAEQNARPQGNNQGNNRVTMAPAEAKNMPVPINNNRIYNSDTCHVSDDDKGKSVSFLSVKSPLAEDRHRQDKGTAEEDKKTKPKKESRIEGKPGSLCGRCPYRDAAFVRGRGYETL